MPGQESVSETFPVLFVSQLVWHWLQFPDTSGQSLPMPCPSTGSKEEGHEDCVVRPARNTARADNKNIERDVATGLQRDDTSLSRWSPASWLNLLLEKHAWLSAGSAWMHGASESGIKGMFEVSGPEGLESRPTINLFEKWGEGARLPKLVNARNYSFF